jgi:hypothetical protein
VSKPAILRSARGSIPEYWLVASDDAVTRQRLDDLLKSMHAPMAAWRQQNGLVRTLETAQLTAEVQRLVGAGSPCVHVVLDGGAPDLDLRLKAQVPPLERYRVVVRRLHDESTQRLLAELAEPDAWSLLQWHFGGHQSIPALPASPRSETLALEHESAFRAWADSLTEEDRESLDDLFGAANSDPAQAEVGEPLRDQPEAGAGWEVPDLPVIEEGYWVVLPMPLAAQARGMGPTWEEQGRWDGPGRAWTVILSGQSWPVRTRVTLHCPGDWSRADDIQVWMIPKAGLPLKVKMGRVEGGQKRATLEQVVPDVTLDVEQRAGMQVLVPVPPPPGYSRRNAKR